MSLEIFGYRHKSASIKELVWINLRSTSISKCIHKLSREHQKSAFTINHDHIVKDIRRGEGTPLCRQAKTIQLYSSGGWHISHHTPRLSDDKSSHL